MGLGRLIERLQAWEKKSREKYTHDIQDPEERRKSQFYMDWIDHGILRYRWHNFSEISVGVYRSNHPTRERFEAYAAKGVRTILNLRGATKHSHYKFEVEVCEQLGLQLIDIPLSARKAPERNRLLECLDILETIEKPFLMHCKSGADRTGLISAIYLLHVVGTPIEEARKQLSLRFVHLNFTKTGILDYLLYCFAKRQEAGAISFKDWVTSEYDQVKLQEEFNATTFFERLKF